MKRARHDGRLIDLFDLHIGADLFPELLQHLTVIAAARRRGDDHLEIDRLAIILDQRFGFFDVVGQRAVVPALHPRTIAIRIGRGLARPLVSACDIFLRSSAITSAWRTRTSSNGGTLVLKAATEAPDPV